MDKEAFKNLLSYLKHLHVTGKLSKSAYETLVSHVLSTFTVNTISREIEQKFGEIYVSFEQVEKSFLNSIDTE